MYTLALLIGYSLGLWVSLSFFFVFTYKFNVLLRWYYSEPLWEMFPFWETVLPSQLKQYSHLHLVRPPSKDESWDGIPKFLCDVWPLTLIFQHFMGIMKFESVTLSVVPNGNWYNVYIFVYIFNWQAWPNSFWSVPQKSLNFDSTVCIQNVSRISTLFQHVESCSLISYSHNKTITTKVKSK